MAYRFNGTSDFLQFALGSFSGYTMDANTAAVLLKRNALAATLPTQSVVGFNSTGNITWRNAFLSNDTYAYRTASGGNSNGPILNSTSLWYLLAVTRAAGASGIIPRFHVWNGTSWTHSAGDSTTSSETIAATDVFRVGDNATLAQRLGADIVCVGIKKATSSDAAIETLSPTSFAAWTGFGFDWLVGFDATSARANTANPGSSDESSRSGTTLVSDPPGWTWVAAAPVADFTGTPLTGSTPLSVAFTDTSTNTPTTWLWNFGDGTTSTSQNPTHSYTTGGIYTVSLTATNTSGSNTKTRTAYVTATEAVVFVAGGGVSIW